MSNHRFMNKIKDILVVLFTRCNRRPDTLAPAHTGLTACALRDPSVNHDRPNLTFCTIIRRFDTRFRQKSEVIHGRITFEPFGQLFGQLMIRRFSHLFQKARFGLVNK